jgi:hypothetical protein
MFLLNNVQLSTTITIFVSPGGREGRGEEVQNKQVLQLLINNLQTEAAWYFI